MADWRQLYEQMYGQGSAAPQTNVSEWNSQLGNTTGEVADPVLAAYRNVYDQTDDQFLADIGHERNTRILPLEYYNPGYAPLPGLETPYERGLRLSKAGTPGLWSTPEEYAGQWRSVAQAVKKRNESKGTGNPLKNPIGMAMALAPLGIMAANGMLTGALGGTISGGTTAAPALTMGGDVASLAAAEAAAGLSPSAAGLTIGPVSATSIGPTIETLGISPATAIGPTVETLGISPATSIGPTIEAMGTLPAAAGVAPATPSVAAPAASTALSPGALATAAPAAGLPAVTMGGDVASLAAAEAAAGVSPSAAGLPIGPEIGLLDTAKSGLTTAFNWLKTPTGASLAGSALNAVTGIWAGNAAADAQIGATNAAIAELRRQYDQTRADWAPWREAGQAALADLVKYTNNPSEYLKSPGYEWLLDQGLQALERRASSKGQLGTGAHTKDILEFAQGLASQDYQNFLNRLGTIAGYGTQSTQSTTTAGTAITGAIADNALRSGDARASGYVNTANAITGAANSAIYNMLLQQALGV